MRQFGMSDIVGLVSFSEEDGQNRRPYSDSLHCLMEVEANKIVAKAYRQTESILLNNRDKLRKVYFYFCLFNE